MVKKHRADFLLLGGILLAGAALAVIILLTQRSGSTVQVRVDGRVTSSFALDRDMEFEITGAGGGRNLLIIRGGSAWIEEADCPDGLCIGMGKISRVGQSVVCLPHRVVVEITGDARESVDVTAG